MYNSDKVYRPQKGKYDHVNSKLKTGWTQERFVQSLKKQAIEENEAKCIRRLGCRKLDEYLGAPSPDVEVLLLDLRDEDAFEQAHLKGAVSYPARLLTRAHQCFSKQVLEFCNAGPKRIIVLYDTNERISQPAARFFFEKGVDNAFILTGGMEAVAEKCPLLIEGVSLQSEGPRPVVMVDGFGAGVSTSFAGASTAGSLKRFSTGSPRGGKAWH